MATLLSGMLAMVLFGHRGSDCAAEVTPIPGMQGGSVRLSPMVPSGFNPRKVFWRHLSPEDHLVASFSQGSSDTTYQSCFYGRVQLLNFTLEISGLKLGDTGMFTCQMVDHGGHMKLYQFYLTVYEPVTTPEVRVFVSRESQGCSVFLSCNTTKGTNVTYKWMAKTGKGELLNETFTLLDENRLLKIFLTLTHQDISLICIVANPVSREHFSVIPWTNCLGQPGQASKVFHGEIILCIAALLVFMFTAGMFSVFLFTRGSGGPPLPARQKNQLHHKDTLLQWTEETVGQENQEVLIQHYEVDVAQQDRVLRTQPNVETLYGQVRKKTLPCNKQVLAKQEGEESTLQQNELMPTQQSSTQYNEEAPHQLKEQTTRHHEDTLLQWTEETVCQENPLAPIHQNIEDVAQQASISGPQPKLETLYGQVRDTASQCNRQGLSKQEGEESTLQHNELMPTQQSSTQYNEEAPHQLKEQTTRHHEDTLLQWTEETVCQENPLASIHQNIEDVAQQASIRGLQPKLDTLYGQVRNTTLQCKNQTTPQQITELSLPFQSKKETLTQVGASQTQHNTLMPTQQSSAQHQERTSIQ